MQVRQALIALAIAVTGVFATTANAGVLHAAEQRALGADGKPGQRRSR